MMAILSALKELLSLLGKSISFVKNLKALFQKDETETYLKKHFSATVQNLEKVSKSSLTNILVCDFHIDQNTDETSNVKEYYPRFQKKENYNECTGVAMTIEYTGDLPIKIYFSSMYIYNSIDMEIENFIGTEELTSELTNPYFENNLSLELVPNKKFVFIISDYEKLAKLKFVTSVNKQFDVECDVVKNISILDLKFKKIKREKKIKKKVKTIK